MGIADVLREMGHKVADAHERAEALAAENAKLRDPSRLWEALKAQCASDPAEAKRLVMVSEDAFNTAFRAALSHGDEARPKGGNSDDDWPWYSEDGSIR